MYTDLCVRISKILGILPTNINMVKVPHSGTIIEPTCYNALKKPV